jgi:uncharacterized membrane protein YkvA (DUF1232 family)
MTEYDPNHPDLSEDDDDLEESMRETAVVPVSRERAERFYDRLRQNIQRYLAKKGSLAGKTAEWLLLVPDVFILLWRLINDARVNGKNKVMLGSGLAYYLFPLDIIPEGFLGPTGYVDDLVLAVYMLNRVLADTDPEVLREHWSGREDILSVIQRILGAADNLVGKDLLGRVKKLVK